MLCEQLPELEVVKAFNNPENFLLESPDLDFDFCILDIEMPNINGLEVAQKLEGKPIIFTTAYKEFAAEAFDIDAVDYIRKPIAIERLRQAILKVKQRLSTNKSKSGFIQLNTNKGKAILHFDQLLYVKASEIDSRDKIAYKTDGTELTLKNIPFEKLQQLLPVNRFTRINKKELISLDVIQAFSSNEITTTIVTKSGRKLILVLSEVYRDEFIEKLKI